MSPPEAPAGYQALRYEAGAVWLPRDFVVVDGPDALSYLQGQLSQDVGLDNGHSTWALLLQPQGKLVAFLRVLRLSESRFVLETDAGFGPTVAERLTRFKLRVKADVGPLEGWRCLAVRGPRAHEAVAAGGAVGTVVVADWPGLPGADLVGEAPEPPEGVPLCDLEAYEAVRIEAGIPVMGREMDESTIPAEAGVVEQSVSFTKGCYTGQELVARIDSRGGNVPRKLRGVVVSGGSDLPPPAATVQAGDGKDVGRLTSVAWSPQLGAPVALAYVRRAVSPPAEVTLVWEGGSAPARVEPLPLVP
ncbi:MAG TPA: glycine cleavage T C-terminal barrel domain-containing protein [Acidimicrobiales bacterium]|nr:glycine cleavage T C-terminal barrel domain-containing protein [Acidimicrobiales bacterium]